MSVNESVLIGVGSTMQLLLKLALKPSTFNISPPPRGGNPVEFTRTQENVWMSC
jgi:hypothetical protein